MAPVAPAPPASPPTLSHFVIFNPTLLPPTPSSPLPTGQERDRDLEDDLREAAQILFYTSREAGGVSRDKMLRQVGLAKGIMGLMDIASKDAGNDYYSVHGNKSRLLLFSPEKDFYIYVVSASLFDKQQPLTPPQSITLAQDPTTKEPAQNSQGISDNLLVAALQRGYDDFRVGHLPIAPLSPPQLTAPSSSTLHSQPSFPLHLPSRPSWTNSGPASPSLSNPTSSLRTPKIRSGPG
ncbi:hypothetical protein P7C73_g5237, partial [Tremellales sp. Uapishka_1]